MNYIILAVLIADYIIHKIISKKLVQKSANLKYKRFQYIKEITEDTELNRLIRWHNIHFIASIVFVAVVGITQVIKWFSL